MFGVMMYTLLLFHIMLLLTNECYANTQENLTLNVLVVIKNQDTIFHLVDKREKLIDSAVKINYPLLKDLEVMLNLTLNFMIEYCGSDNQFDTVFTNKEYENCTIEKLITNKADISAYPLLLTEDKVKLLEFVALSIPGSSKFIFLRPKLSYITNVYTLPFNPHVWMASLFLVIILTVIFYIVTKWHWHKYKQTQTKSTKETSGIRKDIPGSFISVAFITVAAICQQGSHSVPNNLYGRIVMWCLYMSLMFLYASYSANIVALLQSSSTNIRTLKDLFQSSLTRGIEDNEIFHELLDKQEQGVENFNYVNARVGIEHVRNELYAFHVETNIGYSLIEQTYDDIDKCGLQTIKFLHIPTDLYLPMRKGSQYAEVFKIGFLRLQELGIQRREYLSLYTQKPKCWIKGARFVSIGLTDCYFALLLYGGGVALSILILLFEKLIFWGIQTRKKQTEQTDSK